MKTLHIYTQGGLCNRLIALTSASIFARSLKRELRVTWKIVSGDHLARFTDLFMDTHRHVNQDAKTNRPPHGLCYRTPSESSILEIEKRNALIDTVHIASYLPFSPSAMKPEEFTRCFHEELSRLKPIPEIESRIIAGAEKMIGLHIRRTDHWRSTRYSPLGPFIRILEKHIKEDPDIRFYLCSDSPEVKSYFKKSYGKTIVCHEDLELNRLTRTGTQDALVELLTLSKTRCIYGTWASTFPLIAHYFNQRPLIIISNFVHPLWNFPPDLAMDRFLAWDYASGRWTIKEKNKKTLWHRYMALMLMLRCRLFCSDAYQHHVSRWLTVSRKKPITFKSFWG